MTLRNKEPIRKVKHILKFKVFEGFHVFSHLECSGYVMKDKIT
jgi:hypothetical protein